jgi:predicted DNA binding CopG/RHH family protein
MAKINKSPVLKDIDEIQDAIFASNTGLSRKFVTKNDKMIQISNAAVSNVLQGYGYGAIGGSNANSISELANVVQQTIINNRPRRILIGQDDKEDVSGIRMLSPIGNIDIAEQEIININASMYQSFINRTTEYRGVVELIPEAKRAIENIIRDIVNVSDITNMAFNNVYKDKDDLASSLDEKAAIERKNKIIIEEIVKKNNLEIKYKRWLFESAVSGVKPVAFFPYSYIFRQLKNSTDKLGYNIGSYQSKIRKGESFSIFKKDDKKSIELFQKANIEYSLLDCVSNLEKVKSGESVRGIEYDKIIEEIIDDNSAESYADFVEYNIQKGLESLSFRHENIIDTIEKRRFTGTESGSDDLNKDKDIIEKLQVNYKEKQEKINDLPKEERIKLARQGLKEFVEFIDEHIKVPKRESSGAVLAEKILREKDRYDKLYDLGHNYKIAENLRKEGYKDHNVIKDDTIGAFDIKSSLGKECLIVPYSAESVIPININGEYLGFYCLEYEQIMGDAWRKRRRGGSFTDFLKQQGIGDDSSFLGSNYAVNGYGGIDPLENNLYSPTALYNYNTSQYLNGGSGDNMDTMRFDTMKTIVSRVLAHRLHDPDLIDNKLFKDAIMHLLRNDVLVRNKIQFTYVPPEYMCYMTWKTDDDGLPISILDGTLYDCYLHISSKTASGMIKLLKSGDKEKYEIDVGLNKNLGYSVDELQRVLSTRNVYSQSMFSNLATVLKMAGNYQRLIIPVVKDRKLYEVTQIEHMNDLSPDDDFTNQRLQSVLSRIYYNSGVFSELDNVDFARQLTTKNLEYSACIKESQFNYNPYGTKILRILTANSSLPTYNSIVDDINQLLEQDKVGDRSDDTRQEVLAENIEEDIDKENSFDIACIELVLIMPSYLQMLSITDNMDTAKTMANSIAEAYGNSGGNQVTEAVTDLFKLKIIKDFTKNIDWIKIDDMRREAITESKAVAADVVKTATIDEHIQNPIESQTDIAKEPEKSSDTDMDSGMGEGNNTIEGGGDMGNDLGF